MGLKPRTRRGGRAGAWRTGARFDGWDEYFDWNLWQSAFERAGLDVGFYARRERPLTERLPWDHVVGRHPRAALEEQWMDYRATMGLSQGGP